MYVEVPYINALAELRIDDDFEPDEANIPEDIVTLPDPSCYAECQKFARVVLRHYMDYSLEDYITTEALMGYTHTWSIDEDIELKRKWPSSWSSADILTYLDAELDHYMATGALDP